MAFDAYFPSDQIERVCWDTCYLRGELQRS